MRAEPISPIVRLGVVCASPTAFTLTCMRAWWDRIVESVSDYIAVYGWADPTSSIPPTWIDDPCWDDPCDGDRAGQGDRRYNVVGDGSGDD
jgi:hypothetical protein